MRFLHLSRQLAKQKKDLIKTGKIGERVVATFEMIIDNLRQAGCNEDIVFCKRTKNGEQRMKNCVKYDLGSGYRLVTVRSGDHLFVTFIGDHDATDTWFDRHRYDDFTPDDNLYQCEEIVTQDETDTELTEYSEESYETDLYEEELQARLDDSILKSIFQGLYNNRSLGTDAPLQERQP